MSIPRAGNVGLAHSMDDNHRVLTFGGNMHARG